MNKREKPSGCCPVRAIKPLTRPDREKLLSVTKALADPNRLEILRLLAAQSGPLCACDIVDLFQLSQPTVSHHLKILKDAGLLCAERSGLWMFYEIRAEGVVALNGLLELLGSRQAISASV